MPVYVRVRRNSPAHTCPNACVYTHATHNHTYNMHTNTHKQTHKHTQTHTTQSTVA